MGKCLVFAQRSRTYVVENRPVSLQCMRRIKQSYELNYVWIVRSRCHLTDLIHPVPLPVSGYYVACIMTGCSGTRPADDNLNWSTPGISIGRLRADKNRSNNIVAYRYCTVRGRIKVQGLLRRPRN